MPNGEQEPTGKTPDKQQRQEVRRVGMPVIVYDRTHAVAISRNEKGALIVRVTNGDTHLFSAAVTPENSIHVVTPGNKKPAERPAPASTPEQPPAAEQQELLAPPITIEGVPAREYGARFDREKRTYYLLLAHHPDPDDRAKAEYYEIVAEGDKAEQCYKAYITDTKTAVRITGTDISFIKKQKGKPDRTVHRVQADSIEKIKGRWDSPEILHEKVRITNREQA